MTQISRLYKPCFLNNFISELIQNGGTQKVAPVAALYITAPYYANNAFLNVLNVIDHDPA